MKHRYIYILPSLLELFIGVENENKYGGPPMKTTITVSLERETSDWLEMIAKEETEGNISAAVQRILNHIHDAGWDSKKRKAAAFNRQLEELRKTGKELNLILTAEPVQEKV